MESAKAAAATSSATASASVAAGPLATVVLILLLATAHVQSCTNQPASQRQEAPKSPRGSQASVRGRRLRDFRCRVPTAAVTVTMIVRASSSKNQASEKKATKKEKKAKKINKKRWWGPPTLVFPDGLPSRDGGCLSSRFCEADSNRESRKCVLLPCLQSSVRSMNN